MLESCVQRKNALMLTTSMRNVCSETLPLIVAQLSLEPDNIPNEGKS